MCSVRLHIYHLQLCGETSFAYAITASVASRVLVATSQYTKAIELANVWMQVATRVSVGFFLSAIYLMPLTQ